MPRNYRVEITRTAESDILKIFRYILQDNRTAAVEWIGEIEKQIDSLENFPMRCPVIPEAHELRKEYRHLIYGNYRTIFRIEASKVIIMRVVHSAQLFDLRMFRKSK